jgi:4-hydroxythreonine-4-phosphate dehydrogenase
MTAERPRVAITMGDAAGIGPEIIVRSLADPQVARRCVPVVLGDARVLERAMAITGTRLALRPIAEAAAARGETGTLDCLDYGDIDLEHLQPGLLAASNGAAAVRYTREAARLALAGTIDAIVSAPLNKEAMHQAGLRYEGATEIFAEEARVSRYAMVLLLGRMRLMLFTNHMALREVCDRVTTERILDKLELAHEALREMGIEHPRIAVAGLNPHAGEGGLFGREEQDGIIPAIEAARARGIDALGPFPADTVFLKARDGAFDLTLALHHDQGLMVVKLLGFGTVVTLLVGLPFIRTSTGHGTAFDIAGTGRADHRNLLEAIRVAAELGSRRRTRQAEGRGAAAAS